MSATDDDRIARISGWLSGELDPAAARAVDREVRSDPAAQRIAAGFRRVDALARDWYDALPVEPEIHAAAPLPTVRPRGVPRLSFAALAGAVLLACVWRIDAAAACAWLCDATAATIGGGAARFEPAAYWSLRPMAIEWAMPGNGDDRVQDRAANDEVPARGPLTRS